MLQQKSNRPSHGDGGSWQAHAHADAGHANAEPCLTRATSFSSTPSLAHTAEEQLHLARPNPSSGLLPPWPPPQPPWPARPPYSAKGQGLINGKSTPCPARPTGTMHPPPWCYPAKHNLPMTKISRLSLMNFAYSAARSESRS